MVIAKTSTNQKPGLGAVLSTTTIGFLSSSRQAHSADPSPYERLKPSVEAFTKFLNTTGIEKELKDSLGFALLPRLGLLSQIQTILNARFDRRELSRLTTTHVAEELPTAHEALRYMRYATAVYGPTMIAAAQLRQHDNSSKTKSSTTTTQREKDTRTWISEHVQVPPDDIVLLDVDYHEGTNHDHLRHLVAVDHVHRTVVLSIRGTYNFSEIVVDITAFSTPCFGGEAHSEIYAMAQRLWKEAVGDTIVNLLKQNEDYELILTGHSLGGGVASLINMMCQQNQRELVLGHPIRCFAFASPPVFTPLECIPEAVQSTTNYILEQDVVSFLSIDSVRHVFHCVRTIEEYMQTKMSHGARMHLVLARTKPPEGMIDAVMAVNGSRLAPKEGAPVLSIPAAANIWMKEQPLGEYDFEACDSLILSWIGVNVDIEYFQYHLPPRYEYALEHLMDQV
ncbi:Sn1-specific diacylglycerol lipase beta [Seminavis robusta]|uniref:sn-1-specific diacylglycerol lipase n=1 Tax=Seminavis robusta TaxID=568900 RepID=A0A9N8HH14_9STRA|nr:Sn1-specific diacylglycerol lipase beta [Seminavis robusta]|eukprot:Sro538_g162540.1 Sn1-specific diacylglycerol lipase beta (452) ;mRNA; r:17214-18569